MNARVVGPFESNREPPDTADLIRRAGEGEREAFQEIVRRYHGLVFRWAAVSLGDRDEAEDVVQLVLIKLYHSLASFRGGARFTTWLYRITRNVLFEISRKNARRSSLLQVDVRLTTIDADSESGDSMDAGRVAAMIRGYLEALPPRQREVFLLADMDGFSPAEIAELLGVAQVTVRTNLLKARRAIRGRLLSEQPKLMEELKS
jgi:RNA polymerase sigma-70 factor (ECF subfamily)